jgi:hypothetical protein
MPNRRFLSLLLFAVIMLFITSLLVRQRPSPGATFSDTPVSIDKTIVQGEAIMGKLGNETLK